MILDTANDNGVNMITINAIFTLIINMKTIVPIIVMIPANRFVNPCSNPSLIKSISAIILLIKSPCEEASMNFNGNW